MGDTKKSARYVAAFAIFGVFFFLSFVLSINC